MRGSEGLTKRAIVRSMLVGKAPPRDDALAEAPSHEPPLSTTPHLIIRHLSYVLSVCLSWLAISVLLSALSRCYHLLAKASAWFCRPARTSLRAQRYFVRLEVSRVRSSP